MNDPLPEHIAARIAAYSSEKRAVYDHEFSKLIGYGIPELAAAEAAHNKAMGYDIIGKPRHNGATENAAAEALASLQAAKMADAALDDLNDIGNAELFAKKFAPSMAYVPELGRWRRWTGMRWLDDDDEALRCAQIIAKSRFDNVASEPDSDQRKRLFAHAQRSSQLPRLQAMLEIARTLGLSVPQREWDADAMLLGVSNGVVNLVTGQPIAPDPRLRISKCASVEFDATAKAPTWCAFLDRIFAGNIALIAFLQRVFGYSITGDTREQILIICHGAGANGKSTLLRAMHAIAGDYGRSCPADTLLATRDDNIRNDVARLAGARLVTAVEVGDGKRLAEAMVKAMTGGDTITARFLHREFFEFVPAFKIWLGTNHRPVIRDDSHALWRRLRLIPFAVTMPDAEQDKELSTKLATEYPGILNWALQGCLAWQRDGLETPEPVIAATADYRTEMDHLGQWLDERCVLAPTAKLQAGLGFKDYQTWAEDRGERPMTMTAFGRKLVERGFHKTRGHLKVYSGVGLCAGSDESARVSGEFPLSPSRAREKNNRITACNWRKKRKPAQTRVVPDPALQSHQFRLWDDK